MFHKPLERSGSKVSLASIVKSDFDMAIPERLTGINVNSKLPSFTKIMATVYVRPL